jgi:hypothetical protein
MVRRFIAAAALVCAVLYPAARASAESPNWSVFYPASGQECAGEPNLYPCLGLNYQIVGSSIFVDGFDRSIYNNDIGGAGGYAVVYSEMCGPTFGCAWAEHTVDEGYTLNLDITEYQNMPTGGYEWCVELYGYGPICHTWDVE